MKRQEKRSKSVDRITEKVMAKLETLADDPSFWISKHEVRKVVNAVLDVQKDEKVEYQKKRTAKHREPTEELRARILARNRASIDALAAQSTPLVPDPAKA